MITEFSYQLLSRAEKEYIESYLWYEEKQEELGEKFANAVRKKLHNISANPYLTSKKKGKFYETRLGTTFPFVIIFLVDKRQKKIIITSIFHTSRNPKFKYKR